MTFTRRRWDAWCLGGGLFLALGGLVDTLFLGGGPWSPLRFAGPIVPLLALRFRIPVGGFPATPIPRLGAAHRRLLAWCVVSFPLALVAAVLAPRNLEAWWIYPIVAGAHMAVTLRLAWRADLERAASRL